MALARRWSALAVLVVGVLLYLAVRQTIVDTGNPKLLPALILLGASVVPVAAVVLVGGRRLPLGVGATTVVLTGLVGGVVGTVTAAVLEFDVRRDLGALPLFGVGLVEEAAKLIAPVVVLLLVGARHRADGLLLGVASGAGFAALETMGFALVVLVQSGGDLGSVDEVLALRGVTSPAAHMAWTGLTAAALWHAAAHRRRPRAWAGLAATYLAVAGLHALWDGTGSDVVRGALAVVALAAVLVVARDLAGDRRGPRAPSGAPLTTAAGPRR
jgi:RsiW-degrading membrane proteinase PrsW (M82 family)